MALSNPFNLLGPQSSYLSNGHHVHAGALHVSQGFSSSPSFHVGSCCPDPEAYAQFIADARIVFEMGAELGHRMHILDLGGGFPGVEGAKVRFEEVILGSEVSQRALCGGGDGRVIMSIGSPL